jgi:tetratricopeptide (TPR) repeat protein
MPMPALTTAPSHASDRARAAPLRPFWLVIEIAVLAAFLLLVYSNHFQNSFHFDDSHTIVDNAAIRALRNLPRFFTDATTFSALPSNQSYRPLVSASLAIDYALAGGLHPFWFQLTGFIYFLAEAVLLALVIKSLLDARLRHALNPHLAVAAAALYALHPANADTVNYIIAQSDILSTLAVLASFAWAQRSSSRSDAFLSLPAAIGVLAKPPAAMFAPLYLIYSWLFPNPAGLPPTTGRRRGLRIAFAFILCGAATAFVSHMTPRQWVAGAGSSTAYLLTQPYVALLYFKTFLWPTGLSADYDLEPFTTLADFRLWAGFVFVFVLAGAALFCALRPKLRVIGFGLIWFILALLPTSLLPLAEVMNDHRTFFPYAGLAMALAGALQLILTPARKWSPVAIAASCCVALACYTAASVATYQRNLDWKDEESLWRDVTLKSPGNGRGLMNYGNTRMAKGDYSSALDYFHRAQALMPNYPVLYINLAIAENATGHPAEAERHFKQVLDMAPNAPDSYTFYSRWLIERGRSAEAVPLLQKALAISPGDLTAQSFLNHSRNPKPAPATDGAEAWLNLSERRYQQKDYPGAIAAAEQAIQLRPGYAEAWNNMGAAYNSIRQYATAAAVLKEALRLKPDLTLARNNLDYARRMLGTH